MLPRHFSSPCDAGTLGFTDPAIAASDVILILFGAVALLNGVYRGCGDGGFAGIGWPTPPSAPETPFNCSASLRFNPSINCASRPCNCWVTSGICFAGAAGTC